MKLETFWTKGFYRTQLELYFLAFVKKDLTTLSNLVSDDVYLLDWEIEADGKEAFLNANREIFNSCSEIKITRQTIFRGEIFSKTDGIDENWTTFFCPITIDIDGQILQVLDLISFNQEGKISGILAYRQ